eukprot:9477498-Pyramimonas_sp.AAC.1
MAALTLRAHRWLTASQSQSQSQSGGAVALEQQWTVGPIDVTDGLGKEVRCITPKPDAETYTEIEKRRGPPGPGWSTGHQAPRAGSSWEDLPPS